MQKNVVDILNFVHKKMCYTIAMAALSSSKWVQFIPQLGKLVVKG